MQLQRKAYNQLLEWKNSSAESKAILIKGARRVGKSYLAEQFAKNEYKSYILIDCAPSMMTGISYLCAIAIISLIGLMVANVLEMCAMLTILGDCFNNSS